MSQDQYDTLVPVRTPLEPTAQATLPTQSRLVELTGRGVGTAHELADQLLIGRGADCQVVLPDFGVSRHHAMITRRCDGTYVLEDLKSRNGTFVNGQAIQVMPLVAGDRIRIGSHCTVMFASYDDIQEHLLESQKLATLGRLASGIAHDFNNMLSAILAGIGDLKETEDLDERERTAILNDVESAGRRAAELTRRVTRFARRETQKSEVVDVAAQLREVAGLLRRTFVPAVQLTLQLAPELTVVGDPSQLHQVWMNLLVNARDAMPAGGNLTVTAERVAGRLAGLDVAITIRDTGSGMSEETRQRMFEPFFTTKSRTSGTGLGLAIVYSVVRTHNGRVDLTSELGKGSEFRVLLPAADSKAPSVALWQGRQLGERTALPPGKALVIDDDELVRRSSARLMRRLGFEPVIETASGGEAIELVRNASGCFQVVLLDLAMPGLNGIETLLALKELTPDIRVIIVSGSGAGGEGRAALEAGATAFLEKPFQTAELNEALWVAIGS